MSIIQGTSKAAGGGYEIDQSIRFNSADSAYLTRTPASTGDQKKWTTSFWFKRCKTGATDYLMTAGQTGTNNGVCGIYINSSDDTIHTYFDTTGANPYGSINSRKFRDPSAWYHFIWAVDAVNTVQRVWVNGEELTLDASKNPPNFAYDMNASGSGKRMSFATQAWGHATFANIYAAEIHHLDGQYITDPTTFGEYDDNGVWRPIEVTGQNYGTNGFHITGADSANLGADEAGTNDFTSSGLTSDDQVTDTPTDNYATWNPNDRTSNATPSDGNLRYGVGAGVGYVSARSTIAIPSSGKFYWEITHTSNGASPTAYYGVASSAASLALNTITAGEVRTVYTINGQKYDGSTSSTYGAAIPTGNVIGVAVDMDAGTIKFASNNQWSNGAGSFNQTYATGTAAFTDLSSSGKEWFAYLYLTQAYGDINFGQTGGFSYTPPTGFSALSTAALPTPAIKDGSKYFQTTLYTGDGNQTQTISQSENSTFNPDLVWIKNRSNAYSHNINDAVRGYTGASPATIADVKVLASNSTDPEGLGVALTTAQQRGFVQESTANGFIVNKGTVGSQDGFYTNANTHTYAAWQWLAANGTASNTDGSITSTVSANTTSGFSIIRAASMASGTIGHGLSQAPDMVIGRMQSEVFNWWTWHQGLTGGTYAVKLNDPAAQAAVATVYTAEPTSSVINVGSSWTSGNPAIFYCFHEVEGFSKLGSYVGTGSSTASPFIWCGFKPAFILFKNASAYQSWCIFDVARQTYNVLGPLLLAEQPDAETSVTYVDALSNGFKLRTTNARVNGSGATHIYAAWAEHSFGGDGVAPATAR